MCSSSFIFGSSSPHDDDTSSIFEWKNHQKQSHPIQKLPQTKTFFCVETTRLEHEQLKTIKQNQKCFRFVQLSDRSLRLVRHSDWPSSVTCIIIAYGADGDSAARASIAL